MQRNLGITVGIFRCSYSNNSWSREKSHFVLPFVTQKYGKIEAGRDLWRLPSPVASWALATIHWFFLDWWSTLGITQSPAALPHQSVNVCALLYLKGEGQRCILPPKILFWEGGLMSKWVMWTDVKIGITGSQMDEVGNWICIEFLKIYAKMYTNFSNITPIVVHL